MSTPESREFDARVERIADDQAKREAAYAEVEPDEDEIRVGDIVNRSAKGKRFIVTDFWTATVGQQRMASLKPVEGYTSASHPVAQLTLVERPGATS